jgi:putative hemolysin
MLAQCLSGNSLDMEACVRPALFVYENMSALKLLRLFRKSPNHMALVVDEYGSVLGFITLDDVLEAIVGDISALGDQTEAQASRRDDGAWLLDGSLSFLDFKELFGIKELPGEDLGYFHTLAGFIMMRLGRIPAPGECFELGDLRIEVLKMDGHRVDTVLAAPLGIDPKKDDVLRLK